MSISYRQAYLRLGAWFTRRARSERGATLVEYALLVALLAVTCIASIDFVADAAADKLEQVGSSVGQP